jgi:hypothetical protein
MTRKVSTTLTHSDIVRIDALASQLGLTRQAALADLVVPAGLLQEEERAVRAGLSRHGAPDGDGPGDTKPPRRRPRSRNVRAPGGRP